MLNRVRRARRPRLHSRCHNILIIVVLPLIVSILFTVLRKGRSKQKLTEELVVLIQLRFMIESEKVFKL